MFFVQLRIAPQNPKTPLINSNMDRSSPDLLPLTSYSVIEQTEMILPNIKHKSPLFFVSPMKLKD